MTQDEKDHAEESRQYDADGSVRPSQDTGWRVGKNWKEFVPSNS